MRVYSLPQLVPSCSSASMGDDLCKSALSKVHGGYITVSHFGRVGWRGKKTDPDAQIQLEAHPDGYVSLRSSHGTYLVTSPSGHLVAWHRGHRDADDWEKFKLIYNTDDTISLRSKVSDKHVSRDNSTSDMLSATTDRVEISERFMVTMTHGKDTLVPNDPRLSKLWAIDHFGDRDMDAVEAWKMSSRSVMESAQPVVVAVIDTGIDYTHPDLQESMWVNPNEIAGNGIDDDGNGIVDDVHGADFANNDGDPMDDQMHGTHCAGTIAATGNNSIGIAGVAWQGVRLMALKFLTSTGPVAAKMDSRPAEFGNINRFGNTQRARTTCCILFPVNMPSSTSPGLYRHFSGFGVCCRSLVMAKGRSLQGLCWDSASLPGLQAVIANRCCFISSVASQTSSNRWMFWVECTFQGSSQLGATVLTEAKGVPAIAS